MSGGRVTTNAITLQVATEATDTPGTLPGSPTWYLCEPNNVGKFGPMLKKMARHPISKNRQARKPALVDLDSTVEWDCDVTYAHVRLFAEALMFAVFKGPATYVVTAVTATGYTVASGGAIADGYLIKARGFATSANNGLKLVAGTSTGTEIKTTGLVAEASPPLGCMVEICGVQLGAGDCTIDSSGNILTTTFDFTTAAIAPQRGQWLWVGGDDALTFFTILSTNRGLGRIMTVAAHKLTMDKRSAVWNTDAGTLKTIQLFWGQFCRNVTTDHADYINRSLAFELKYENLAGSGTDKYEYANGNFVNEIMIDMPGQNKATMKMNFIGLDTPVPTTTRATNASAGIPPAAGEPYNTTSDFMRLRITQIDETGLTTDFTSLSVSIKNDVSAEKVIGQLGGKYMNYGDITVEATASLIFSDSAVLEAMRNNTRVTMEFCLRNDDGAILFDIPSMTIEDGAKSFPLNQSVKINMKAIAYQDPLQGDSLGISTFPHMPAS